MNEEKAKFVCSLKLSNCFQHFCRIQKKTKLPRSGSPARLEPTLQADNSAAAQPDLSKRITRCRCWKASETSILGARKMSFILGRPLRHEIYFATFTTRLFFVHYSWQGRVKHANYYVQLMSCCCLFCQSDTSTNNSLSVLWMELEARNCRAAASC